MAQPSDAVNEARALLEEGKKLTALGRTWEAIADFDDMTARFGSATEDPIRREVHSVLRKKAPAAATRADHRDAIFATSEGTRNGRSGEA